MSTQMAEVHEGIQRRGHCFRNCVVICLLLSLGLVFGIGYVVAKSGLAEVPVLSGWFSSRPNAIEPVSVPDDQLKNLEQRLSHLESQLATGHVQLTLSEADLNALIRLKTPEASIDITDGGFEIQTPIKYTGNELIVTGTIVPVIEAGKLRLELEKVRLGDLPLPASFFNAIALQLQKNLLDSNPVIRAATFEEVTVGNDEVTVAGSIPPEVFEQME